MRTPNDEQFYFPFFFHPIGTSRVHCGTHFYGIFSLHKNIFSIILETFGLTETCKKQRAKGGKKKRDWGKNSTHFLLEDWSIRFLFIVNSKFFFSLLLLCVQYTHVRCPMQLSFFPISFPQFHVIFFVGSIGGFFHSGDHILHTNAFERRKKNTHQII